MVTPEREVLDEQATFVALPAYDGEVGILAGRAPLLARLGTGVLRVESPEGNEDLFVAGGFAQMVDDNLTLLTEEAKPLASLDRAAAAKELAQALAQPANDEAALAAKEKAVTRARAKEHLAAS